MSLILLGQAPSRTSGAGAFPEGSSSRRRLAQLLGVRECAVGQLLELRNLLKTWPGYHRGNGHEKPDGRRRHGGDHFPWEEARREARKLWYDVAEPALIEKVPSTRIIFAGHKVAECFGTFSSRSYETLRWRRLQWLGHHAEVATLPHPSAVNHWYNDLDNVRLAATFLRDASGITEVLRALSAIGVLDVSRKELERAYPAKVERGGRRRP